jgi:hypothetical protein
MDPGNLRNNRINNIATNDRGFFNIDWIKCWHHDSHSMQRR